MIPASPAFELHKKRDFSEVINDTFTFTRIHFKTLIKPVLIIAGPFNFLASLFTSISSVNVFDFATMARDMDIFWLNQLVSSAFLMLAILLLYSVVHAYVKIVAADQEAEKPSVEDVWQVVKRDFWKSVGIGIGFVVIMLLIIGAYALTIAVGGVVFFVFLFLIGIFAITYFVFRFVLAFPAGLIENYSVIDSFSRSWQLTYGNFWSNFGVAFIFSLLIGMVSFVSMVPFLILTFATAMHGGEAGINPIWKFVVIVIQTGGTFIANSAYVVFAIAFILQYFSAVEKTEGTGLLQKIDKLELAKDEDRWSEENY